MEPFDEILPYRASWQESVGGPFFVSSERIESVEEMIMASSQEPRHIMSEAQMDKCIEQLAGQINEKVGDNPDLLLMGIRTRGVPLAEWIAQKFEAVSGRSIPVGVLDINLYRDDLSEVDHQPVVKRTELPTPIQGKGVILVDDVLYTGRTIRAALDALVDFGRPSFVQLAVLIDRGFRELPIQADYVGKALRTKLEENVKVMLEPIDGENQVIVKEQK